MPYNELVNISTPAAKTAYYVGPLLLWMLMIFGFSTDFASAERTRPAVGGIVRRLFPNLARRLTTAQLDRVDKNIRKCAHVTEYAILAILAYRAVAFGNPAFRSRNVVLPFLIGVLYAASDEYHQSFYPSRDGTAADVVFDTFGVTIGLLLCLWQRAAHLSSKPASQSAADVRVAVPASERSPVR
jgi:VanZ family protein